MRTRVGLPIAAVALCAAGIAQTRPPIIDMHLHAWLADSGGPPPVLICAPFQSVPAWDPATGGRAYRAQITFANPPCASPLRPAGTDAELRDESLRMLEQWNITAVASGRLPVVEDWKKNGGRRIIPALQLHMAKSPALSDLREWIKSGRIQVLGEILNQYMGIAPTDPRCEPYWALAEELDVPVAIHLGPGWPGASYAGSPESRARLSNALELEDVLVRHPKLRMYAMHAGWPLGDQMIAALYAHPQLHVDTGVISYILPKAEFHGYLKRMVDAGFLNRIMFGSDQMVWPQAIPIAIANVQSVPFLSEEQKRDILYNNARRFLRLASAAPR